MIVAAASGSVGETIAPSTNATSHGMPGTISCTTQATPHIVATTRPMVLIVRPRRLARKSPKLAKIDDAVQQRREEDDQHDLGVQLHLRQSGDEAESAPPTTRTTG